MSLLGEYVISLLAKPQLYESLDHLWKANKLNSKWHKFKKLSPINKHHDEVVASRLSVHRLKPPSKLQYFTFLKELYPIDVKYVNFNRLMKAYDELPSPRAVHVEQYHFEDLLKQFLQSGGESRNKIEPYFSKILFDLQNSGMEFSLKEYNMRLHLKHYNSKNKESIWNSYHQFNNLRPTLGIQDISTYNIFLKYAVKLRDDELLERLINDIDGSGLKLNRISYDILLNHLHHCKNYDGVHSLVNQLLSNGIILDSIFINSIMKTLIQLNDVESAETILRLLTTTIPISSNFDQNEGISTRREYTNISLFLDTLNLQTSHQLVIPIIPTLETFSPLIHHFLKLRNFDAKRLLNLFNEMKRVDIKIPTSLLVKTIEIFRHRQVKDEESFISLLTILQQQDSKHIKYDDDLLETIIGSSLNQSDYKSKVSKDLDLDKERLSLVSLRSWKEMNTSDFKNDVIRALIAQ